MVWPLAKQRKTSAKLAHPLHQGGEAPTTAGTYLWLMGMAAVTLFALYTEVEVKESKAEEPVVPKVSFRRYAVENRVFLSFDSRS